MHLHQRRTTAKYPPGGSSLAARIGSCVLISCTAARSDWQSCRRHNPFLVQGPHGDGTELYAQHAHCGVVVALLGTGSIVKAGPLDEAVAVALPAQPLGDALRELAKTSGLQLLFDPNLVAGRRAPAVMGTLAPREALLQLLRGTDLEIHEESPGVLVIRARPSRAATEPHNGDPAPVANTPGASALIRNAALEEIVVTAQKRERIAQDVPIAISAVSSQDLVRRNVSDLTDLRGQVPGSVSGGVRAPTPPMSLPFAVSLV